MFTPVSPHLGYILPAPIDQRDGVREQLEAYRSVRDVYSVYNAHLWATLPAKILVKNFFVAHSLGSAPNTFLAVLRGTRPQNDTKNRRKLEQIDIELGGVKKHEHTSYF